MPRYVYSQNYGGKAEHQRRLLGVLTVVSYSSTYPNKDSDEALFPFIILVLELEQTQYFCQTHSDIKRNAQTPIIQNTVKMCSSSLKTCKTVKKQKLKLFSKTKPSP